MWPFKKKIKRYVTFDTASGYRTEEIKEDVEGQYYIDCCGVLHKVIITDYWSTCKVYFFGFEKEGIIFSLEE